MCAYTFHQNETINLFPPCYPANNWDIHYDQLNYTLFFAFPTQHLILPFIARTDIFGGLLYLFVILEQYPYRTCAPLKSGRGGGNGRGCRGEPHGSKKKDRILCTGVKMVSFLCARLKEKHAMIYSPAPAAKPRCPGAYSVPYLI